MKILLKSIILYLALLLGANLGLAAPAGTQVFATGAAQGGSETTFIWRNPVVSTYKVWVYVPLEGTATNALYRIWPKGNPLASTVCSPTDSLAPCFEVAVNQAVNRKKWVQLTLKKVSSWLFSKSGFVSVNASNLATSQILAAATVSFEDTTLKIGNKYGGGIIFYLDASKQHGLVAAPTDQSTGLQWYNGSYFGVGETDTALGTGAANTKRIVFIQGAGKYAAQLCNDLVLGGYNDWFLPSKDELALMYNNIGPGAAEPLKNVGGFAAIGYWTSSESDYANAWYQEFGSGDQYPFGKSSQPYVRAVRAF